jgi:regulator of extracellular matrix RemA (YlzA/DUF370 family)
VNETEYSSGPTRPEGRLLALRCLGLPQVVTRTPVSRRSALRYRLAAYRARIRPRTTAELASLVLRMSDEIDTRERMLDAALGRPGRGSDGADSGHVRIAAVRPTRTKATVPNRLAG